mmetsp:Transcript_154297/g.269956  ORF Transcript_154297/g.269956 Transcript_154297/m.269956 type:complete len:98 (+) Transcript_154297:354-647(+)
MHFWLFQMCLRLEPVRNGHRKCQTRSPMAQVVPCELDLSSAAQFTVWESTTGDFGTLDSQSQPPGLLLGHYGQSGGNETELVGNLNSVGLITLHRGA